MAVLRARTGTARVLPEPHPSLPLAPTLPPHPTHKTPPHPTPRHLTSPHPLPPHLTPPLPPNPKQLHIVKGPEPQGLPPGGAIALVVPSVERAAARLEAVEGLLGCGARGGCAACARANLAGGARQRSASRASSLEPGTTLSTRFPFPARLPVV